MWLHANPSTVSTFEQVFNLLLVRNEELFSQKYPQADTRKERKKKTELNSVFYTEAICYNEELTYRGRRLLGQLFAWCGVAINLKRWRTSLARCIMLHLTSSLSQLALRRPVMTSSF